MKCKNVWRWGVLFVSIISLTNCNKDGLKPFLPEDQKAVHEVKFNLKNFKSELKPLLTARSKVNQIFSASSPKEGNVIADATEQILYFWSFNVNPFVPDLGVDTINSELAIEYNSESGKHSFLNGKSFGDFEAGSALNITGPKSIILKLPIQGIKTLSSLRFDLMSSNTGPKSFDLLYTFNLNADFTAVQEDNNFYNYSASAWNTFDFDISQIPVNFAEYIWIKLVFKGGERSHGSDYNSTSGTLRIDNIGMKGSFMGDTEENLPQDKGNLQYFVFNTIDSTLVKRGSSEISFYGEADLTLLLPSGQYFAFLLYSNSDDQLLSQDSIAEAKDINFATKLAQTDYLVFGNKIPAFSVQGNTSLEVILNRYYSEVQVNFEDVNDLNSLGAINARSFSPTTYSPYGLDSNENEFDISEQEYDNIWLEPTQLGAFYGIVFNHILGPIEEEIPVNYMLDIHSKDFELIRQIPLEATIKRNFQLTFSGNLYSGSPENGKQVQINWNTEWDGQHSIPF